MLLLPLLLAACDALPRDTDGTLARVRARHVVRIGLIADARIDGRAVAALTDRIGRAAHARVATAVGAGEPLFAALDAGDVDLVIGAFGNKTPWASKVALAPPIARYAAGVEPLLVRAAVRNGENRWAMLVEHASRETAPTLADAE